jgi:hypothetical protein
MSKKTKKPAPWGDGCVDNPDGTRSPMLIGGTQPIITHEDTDRFVPYPDVDEHDFGDMDE